MFCLGTAVAHGALHADLVRIFGNPVLGRHETGERVGLGPLVLGYHALPRRAVDCPGQGCIDL